MDTVVLQRQCHCIRCTYVLFYIVAGEINYTVKLETLAKKNFDESSLQQH